MRTPTSSEPQAATDLRLPCDTSRHGALRRVGHALADPTRCHILLALLEGPAYPARLAARLGLTRANVSNHLTCLRGCGLVTATPEGRQVRYELADERLRHALGDLADLILSIEPGHEPERAIGTEVAG
ncbi:MAG TPA: metalloregulator ArsR/SmtB family transcription factor [Streptosporangiaceae bacterium]|jgi:DNA-binding transcriptional ArsR family regulator